MCQKLILDASSVSDLECAIMGLPRFEQIRPFNYLFWIIQAHFKLCFKRKRNKEM